MSETTFLQEDFDKMTEGELIAYLTTLFDKPEVKFQFKEQAQAYLMGFNHAMVRTDSARKTQWLYFLSNVTYWRGDVARAVKATIKRRYQLK